MTTTHSFNPGDVALRVSHIPGIEPYRSILVGRCQEHRDTPTPHWHHQDGGFDPFHHENATYVPLVVLDYRSKDDAERLANLFIGIADEQDVADMQKALLEIVKPVIEEPTEQWTLVQAGDRIFVLDHPEEDYSWRDVRSGFAADWSGVWSYGTPKVVSKPVDKS